MVSRGKFVLHSRVVPPLTAGDYVLRGDHTITASGGARPTSRYDGNIRVTAPRYKLQPDQILSTFPPANSEGAYESRLPQIVIKRRTIPWERIADPADKTIPWLALVVIAEGEGHISDEVPVDQCVTPDLKLTGPNDVARGVYLSVPQTTVNKVFPCKQDLQLLAHVREVDLEDTELAMGDEDGFLAVVMANRLPQFDRVACKAKRYTACLINLEGQLGVLPPPTPPVPDFIATASVFDIREVMAAPQLVGGSPDKLAMVSDIKLGGGPAFRGSRAQPGQPLLQAPAPRHGIQASPSAGAAGEWQVTTAKIETVALTAATQAASATVREVMKTGFKIPIEGLVAMKVYRFPVLTHWSFTCDGAGSFESLMRDLDVGLLGTLPGPNARKPRPPCAPPPAGTAPPDAPPPRPVPEVAETGHVGLDHQTRGGDKVPAWYRGPFVPAPTDREIAMTPAGPALAHTSDQLRAVVPDGREDLSLAVAFEIGRLLALSRPGFVNALMAWRREQFGAERARRLAKLAGQSIAKLAGILDKGVVATLGPLIGRMLVLESAVKPDTVFGPKRPPVDPGRPIDFLAGDMTEMVSVGLGIDASALKGVAESGSLSAIEQLAVPRGKVGSVEIGEGALAAALSAEVQSVAADAMPRMRSRSRAEAADDADALDDLVRRAADRARRETR